MKNIKYLFILVFVSFFAASCEEDLDVIVMPEETVISAPQFSEGLVSSVVLSEETAEETAVTLNWSAAEGDYNGVVIYYIVIGKVGEEFNFANAQVVSTFTGELSMDVTHSQLNFPLLQMGLSPEEEQEVELRVMASLNIDKNFAFSNPIKMKVTPYEVDMGGEPELPKMFMIGGDEALGNWNLFKAAEMLAHDDNGDGVPEYYDACLYLNPNIEFKFVDEITVAENEIGDDENSWDFIGLNLGLGEEGDNGTLINSGDSKNIKVAEEGFYYIWLDIVNGNYKYVKMEWGVIGDLNGWGAEEPLAYDKEAGAYVGKVTIPEEEKKNGWKLRSANTGIAIYGTEKDAWKYNFGPENTAIYNVDNSANYEEHTGEINLTFRIGFQCDATLTIE